MEERNKTVKRLSLWGALTSIGIFIVAISPPPILFYMIANLGANLFASLVVGICIFVVMAVLALVVLGLGFLLQKIAIYIWKEKVWKKQSFFGRNTK